MRVAVRPILFSACLSALIGAGVAEAQTHQKPPLQARKTEIRTRKEAPKPPPPSVEAALPLPLPPIPPNLPAPPHPAAAKPHEAAKPTEKIVARDKPPGDEEKIPRFVSLRANDVNMRVGPGMRYPIQWVYKRRDLPVEITRKFDVWCYVRDADGVEGWMQGATLMGRRSFIVQKSDATLRSEPRDNASPVAILKVGVIGRIRSCEAASDWCQLQVGSYRGYLRREQFWGTFPHEAVNP